MAKSIFQRFITTDTGDIVASAIITVRKMSDNSLAAIYSDDTGTAKANPFTATAGGLAEFYADGGSYKVTATSGLFSVQFVDVLLGNAAGYDVENAAGSLLKRSQMDARYVQIGASLTKLIDVSFDTTQNPSALDTPLQVIFGATDAFSASVNVLGAANATPANRGKINFLGAGQFFIHMVLNFGRTGATDTSKVIILFKENGVAVASASVVLLADADSSVCYTSSVLADITGATTWTFEIIRDSSGDNSGGLVGFNPVLAGVPNVPSSRLAIWKLL